MLNYCYLSKFCWFDVDGMSMSILEILLLEKVGQLIEKWLVGFWQFDIPTMMNSILPNYGDTIPDQLRDFLLLVLNGAIPSRYGELRGT